MKARELLKYFLCIAPWVNPENTVDKIIIGNPEKEISKILTVWQPSIVAVQYAIDNGYDAIMTHEPTFYIHRDELATLESLPDNSVKKKIALKKKQLIESADLVVIRNHDVWDRFPKKGIPWAWADLIGLKGKPADFACEGYQHAYDIQPISAMEFARQMNDRLPRKSEMQFFGDGGKIVSRIGIGTGYACELEHYYRMSCDCVVVCDDNFLHWYDIAPAVDFGIPVIRVFHSTSEDPGMAWLAEYLRQEFPELQADHLPFGCYMEYQAI